MKRTAALLLCLALLCALAPAGAENFSGQSLKTFNRYYSEDVYLINDNTGYHLLPLIIGQRDSGKHDGRVLFELSSDTLRLSGATGTDGDTIERCEITLIAPSGMAVGNAVYNDFVISAYHCYALLMAMEGATQPADRYAVVDLIEQALVDGDGTGALQRGVYTLTGSREGNQVLLTFENISAAPAEGEPAGGEPTEPPEGEAEGMA